VGVIKKGNNILLGGEVGFWNSRSEGGRKIPEQTKRTPKGAGFSKWVPLNDLPNQKAVLLGVITRNYRKQI